MSGHAETAKGANQRTSQKAATRSDILAAAAECVAHAGVEAATMHDIAVKAGVSKSLVHYHFSTKEELLTAVERELFEQILTRIRGVTSELGSTPEHAVWALEQLWRELLDSRTLVPLFLHLAMRSLSGDERSQSFAAFIEHHRAMIHEGAESVLGPWLDRLGLSIDSVVDLLLSAIAGLALQGVLTGDRDRATRSFEDLKRLVFMFVEQRQKLWSSDETPSSAGRAAQPSGGGS